MGVIYIGDREVGKTHLAMELANPNSKHVTVSAPDYESLRASLYDERKQGTKATDANKEIDDRYMEIQVKLPSRTKHITVDWIDTPGEIWRKSWQDKNPEKWSNFLETTRQSEGIILIIPPHRKAIDPGAANPKDYITQQQWCNRFDRWVEFFRTDCPKARHIIICLNKADLFCDIDREASRLRYEPRGSTLTWQKRHTYISKRYFQPILNQLEQMNRSISGLSVNCFITSIYNRDLLELPWIYLGSFLTEER